MDTSESQKPYHYESAFYHNDIIEPEVKIYKNILHYNHLTDR